MSSGDIFTCWTNNCRGAANDALYVIHAIREGNGNRSICGCKIQEFGMVALIDMIDCKRCLRSLLKHAPV